MSAMAGMRICGVGLLLACAAGGCAADLPGAELAGVESEEASPTACYVVEIPDEIEARKYIDAVEPFERPPVCLAATAQLNRHCDRSTDQLERIPPGGGISYPQWETLEPAAHQEFLKALADLDGTPESRALGWAAIQRRLQHDSEDQAMQLRSAMVDLSDAGTPERVYLVRNLPPEVSTFQNWQLFAWNDLEWYLKNRHFPRVRHLRLGDASVPLLFASRTYVVSSGPDMVVKRTTASGYDEVVCVIRPVTPME